MSLRHGRETVAIPGPSIMPERVLAAFRRAMPNIYEGELLDVSEELLDGMKPIAKTDGHLFVTIGNGHSAWEMTTSNVFNAGDTVLVLEGGRFATAWGEGGGDIGCEGRQRPRVRPSARRRGGGAGKAHVDAGRLLRRRAHGPRRYRDVSSKRCRGRARCDRCRWIVGAIDGRLHRVNGVRRVPHGRMGGST